MYTIYTEIYKTLVWIAEKTADSGYIEIYCGSQPHFSKRYVADGPWYDIIPLQPETAYTIFIKSVDIKFAYLCGCPDELERGVCFLEFHSGAVDRYDSSNLEHAYEQKFRCAFHFSTFKNWMNDPNGLCRYQGYYHMFYQMNPAGLQWGNVYWGHAVSKDLLHWNHLPIALFPQKDLYGLTQYKGGAYSGSALAEEDRITLYFTRHFSPLEKGILTKEIQVQAVSKDGVLVEQETPIITEKPGGPEDVNFRDPKAVYLNGRKNLLISTTIHKLCTVERYEWIDGSWHDKGPFFQDRLDCDTVECANLVTGGDGSCALLFSLQNMSDPFGRKRLMKYYIGSIDQNTFQPESSGIYDFGTECYALQTFEDGDRTLAFGWIVSAYGEFEEEGSRSNGCITLPRELSVRGRTLYSTPARETRQLLYETIPVIQNGLTVNPMPGRAALFHLRLRLTENTSFRIILAKNREQRLGLEYDGNILKLIHGLAADRESAPFLHVKTSLVTDLELFMDKSAVEIFVNQGRYVGTKTYFFEPDGSAVEYEFERRQAVQLFEISKVKNIWKK